MEKIIYQTLDESIALKTRFFNAHARAIVDAARLLAERLRAGNKILLFGNGGSAADAQHMAAEFVNRFQMERPPLAALALTCDSSVLTSIANDYAFEEVFLKQVQALGRDGDVAVAISTSGNSPNVIRAAQAARDSGLTVIGFSGPGGRLREIAHMAFCVDSKVTARIQEVHITLAHMLCDLSERILFNA
jgi:D-sedoheptulose 7-phosphate isomerase